METSLKEHEEHIDPLIEESFVQISKQGDDLIYKEGNMGNTIDVIPLIGCQNSTTGSGNLKVMETVTECDRRGSLKDNTRHSEPKKLITEDLVKVMHELQCAKETLENVNMEKDECVKNLNDALDIERMTREGLGNEVKTLKEDMAKKRSELESMQVTANSQKQRISCLEKEKSEIQKLKSDELALKQQTIDEMKKLLSENEVKAKEKLKSQIETIEGIHKNTISDMQAQIEKISEECKEKIQQYESTIDNLARDLNESEQNVKQFLDDIHKKCIEVSKAKQHDEEQKREIKLLTQRVDRLKKENDQNQAELHSQREEVIQKDKLLQELKGELQQYKDQINILSRNNEEISQRLSEEWSQKVSSDESNIENISIKNRPMNLTSEYEYLCSHQWLDAKNALDERSHDEDLKQRTLCEILMESEQIACNKYKALMQNIMGEVLHSRYRLSGKVTAAGNHSQVYKDELSVVNTVCSSTQTELNWAEHGELAVSNPQKAGSEPSLHVPMETDQNEEEANKQQGTKHGVSSGKNTQDENEKTATHNASNTQPLASIEMATSDGIENYKIKRPPYMCSRKDAACDDKSVKQQELVNEQRSKETHTQSQDKIIEIPDTLNNAVGDYFRVDADSIDVGSITKDLLVFLQSKCQTETQWLSDLVNHPKIRNYIEACAKLTWKMILQRPSMIFSNKGEQNKWDEKSQEPTYGCHDPKHPQAIVVYYVTPTLLHADRVMTKGKVMIRIQNNS